MIRGAVIFYKQVTPTGLTATIGRSDKNEILVALEIDLEYLRYGR